MQVLLLTLLSLISFIPGLFMRYIPFRPVITRRTHRLLMISYAILIIATGLVYLTFGYTVGISVFLIKASIFLFGVVSAFINIAVIGNNYKMHLFAYGLSTMLRFMLIIITEYVNKLTTGMDSITDLINGALLFVLLNLLFYYPIRQLMIKTITPFLSIDSGNYWDTMWFVPILLYISFLFVMPGEIHVQSVYHIFGCIAITAATVFICLSMAKDSKNIHEKQMIDAQLKIQTAYYHELKDHVELTRKFRHDFKHHMVSIQNYINNDDKEGLQKYCYSISERQTHSVIPYTGNAAIDGVLYHYQSIANEHGITLTYSGTVKNHSMEDIDLCVLLGNALDNAVTGCLTIEKNRTISVVAESEEHVLSILVTNTFDGVINKTADIIMSRKADNRTGVGLKSMAEICNRHGGSMDIAYDDNTFTVVFVLPN